VARPLAGGGGHVLGPLPVGHEGLPPLDDGHQRGQVAHHASAHDLAREDLLEEVVQVCVRAVVLRHVHDQHRVELGPHARVGRRGLVGHQRRGHVVLQLQRHHSGALLRGGGLVGVVDGRQVLRRCRART
jgi:hypothetical protein